MNAGRNEIINQPKPKHYAGGGVINGAGTPSQSASESLFAVPAEHNGTGGMAEPIHGSR
jgi:hypothetical protein